MQTRRWVNQSQPQTLVFSTILLYFNVVWVILGANTVLGAAVDGHKIGGSVFMGDTGAQINNFARLFIAIGGAAAGYLISNEKKVGYYLGIAVAGLPLLAEAVVILRFQYFNFDLVTVAFQVAQLALILHTQSRNYVRLWFK